MPERRPKLKLPPGKYRVAVGTIGHEVDLEVGEEGEFTPKNDDELQAATLLGAEPVKGK